MRPPSPGTPWRPGILLALACGAALLAAGSSAFAEGSDWQPGFSFYSGLQARHGEASVSSPRDVAPGVPFRNDAETIYGFVELNLEASSPGFGPARALRFFAHVGAAYSFDGDDNIVNEGAPGPVYVTNVKGVPNYNSPLVALNGQGSATEVRAEPLVVSAGLGLSFEFESWGRSLRVKPSVEWLWQESTITGKMGYALANSDGGTAGNPLPSCDGNANPPGCPRAYLTTGSTKGFHSIGPGVELEMDAGRAGPFMLSLFVSGQFYRFLGDRGIEASAQGELSPIPDPPASADIDLLSGYEMDPWHYRTGVGLRFRWMPE